MQLPLAEFIRRLRRHFLPPHFVKIRRYGCWPTATPIGPQPGLGTHGSGKFGRLATQGTADILLLRPAKLRMKAFLWSRSGWKGPMESVQEGFLGLRFQASDGFHFGWLRVNRGGGGMLAQIVPVDFAWETQPGIPISAGAVPKPSSIELIAIGGAFTSWIRRRQQVMKKLMIAESGRRES